MDTLAICLIAIFGYIHIMGFLITLIIIIICEPKTEHVSIKIIGRIIFVILSFFLWPIILTLILKK